MDIPEKIKESMTDLMPSGMEWLRAGIASIPFVGGGLDHLLFDKYAEIQEKNIKHNRKILNADGMDEPRLSLFRELMELSERCRRKNQYK